MEEYPATVRKWKDVVVGDLVLIGHPLEMLLVTKITLRQDTLGHGKRYISVIPPNGILREYLCYDEDWTTVLVKEGA